VTGKYCLDGCDDPVGPFTLTDAWGGSVSLAPGSTQTITRITTGNSYSGGTCIGPLLTGFYLYYLLNWDGSLTLGVHYCTAGGVSRPVGAGQYPPTYATSTLAGTGTTCPTFSRTYDFTGTLVGDLVYPGMSKTVTVTG
jgi:hypothetical protein